MPLLNTKYCIIVLYHTTYPNHNCQSMAYGFDLFQNKSQNLLKSDTPKLTMHGHHCNIIYFDGKHVTQQTTKSLQCQANRQPNPISQTIFINKARTWKYGDKEWKWEGTRTRMRDENTRILLGEDWEWWVVMIRDVVHWNTTHKKRERSSIIVCDNPTTLNKMFDLSLEV